MTKERLVGSRRNPRGAERELDLVGRLNLRNHRRKLGNVAPENLRVRAQSLLGGPDLLIDVAAQVFLGLHVTPANRVHEDKVLLHHLPGELVRVALAELRLELDVHLADFGHNANHVVPVAAFQALQRHLGLAGALKEDVGFDRHVLVCVVVLQRQERRVKRIVLERVAGFGAVKKAVFLGINVVDSRQIALQPRQRLIRHFFNLGVQHGL